MTFVALSMIAGYLFLFPSEQVVPNSSRVEVIVAITQVEQFDGVAAFVEYDTEGLELVEVDQYSFNFWENPITIFDRSGDGFVHYVIGNLQHEDMEPLPPTSVLALMKLHFDVLQVGEWGVWFSEEKRYLSDITHAGFSILSNTEDASIRSYDLVPDTPTPALTATPTPSATPTIPPALACTGDCNGDREVTVDELTLAVKILLHGNTKQCPAADENGDGVVTVDEVVTISNIILSGCPIILHPQFPDSAGVGGNGWTK